MAPSHGDVYERETMLTPPTVTDEGEYGSAVAVPFGAKTGACPIDDRVKSGR
jgi:hypothetical protein